MAAYTSVRSGNWNDASNTTGPWRTSGSGGVPVAGDSVVINIGHTVTVSDAETVGKSAGSYDLNVSGTLSIASGGNLTLACYVFLYGVVNLTDNATLTINAGYGLRCSGAGVAINAIASSAATPCKITSVGTTSGNAGSVYTGASGACSFTYTNCVFTNFQQNTSSYETLIKFTGCTFKNQAVNIYQSGTALAATTDFELINCTWTGTSAAQPLAVNTSGYCTGAGKRIIQGCSFDAPVNLSIPYSWQISKSYFCGNSTAPPLYTQSSGTGNWSFLDQCTLYHSNTSSSVQGTVVHRGCTTNNIWAFDQPNHVDINVFIAVVANIDPVTTSASAGSGVTSIAVNALRTRLPVGTVLYFGGVKALVTSQAEAGATSIAVAATSGSIGSAVSTTPVIFIGNTMQANSASSNGAWLYFPAMTPTTDVSCTVKNNNVLPNMGHTGASGSLFNTSGITATSANTYVTIEHNTSNVDPGTTVSGSAFYSIVYLGDLSGNIPAGTVASLRSNLGWGNSAAASTSLILNESGTITRDDVVVKTACGYNGGVNLYTSSANAHTTKLGYAMGANGFSSAPLADTTDVNADPLFVDKTRNLATYYTGAWGQSQTTTGTSLGDWRAVVGVNGGAGSTPCYLQANPTLTQTVLSAILAGYVPTNLVYNTTYIGDLNSISSIGAANGAYVPPWPMIVDTEMTGSFYSMGNN